MKYGIGQTLADYGFALLEKTRNPMFLIHRDGTVAKINEAGRKFLKVSRLEKIKISEYAKIFSAALSTDFKSVKTSGKRCKVLSRSLQGSDYVLVEVYR